LASLGLARIKHHPKVVVDGSWGWAWLHDAKQTQKKAWVGLFCSNAIKHEELVVLARPWLARAWLAGQASQSQEIKHALMDVPGHLRRAQKLHKGHLLNLELH
jgi:hypothetical protein